MTTVTRTRLDRCATKGCPAPDSEEWHQPWCRGIYGHQCFGDATHQHTKKRSQGGKVIDACLCAGMHDAVDNGTKYANKVIEFDDGERVYRLWDAKTGEILIDRVIQEGASSDGGEERAASSLALEPSTLPSSPGASFNEDVAPDMVPPMYSGEGVSNPPSPPNSREETDEAHLRPRGLRGGAGATTTRRESTGGRELRSQGDALSGPTGDVQSNQRDGGQTEGLGQDGDNLLAPSIAEREETHADLLGRARTRTELPSRSRSGAVGAGADKEESFLSVLPPNFADNAGRDSRGFRVLLTPAAVTPPSIAEPATFTENGIDFEPEITFKEWVKAAERVKAENIGRMWRAGDLYNAGEDRWAEAHQYLDELGYPEMTLANFANVAKAFPLAQRRTLPFTYHQSCYKHPDRFNLLDRALTKGWTRSELRDAAGYARKISPLKFTVEQLKERLALWPGERSVRNNARRWTEAWLESLE
jgi:hypothetical protein